MPDALDNLAPEERCQVYGMLRLKVEIAADGSVEARGVLSETLQVLYENDQVICETGVASRGNIQITKTPELRFRAVLGNGTSELRLARLIG